MGNAIHLHILAPSVLVVLAGLYFIEKNTKGTLKMADKGIGVKECPEHGEYFLDADDSPCPSCEDRQMKSWQANLGTGDEVYWNDPDADACSGHATFVGHMSYVDGVSVIVKDGIKMQIFTQELS